MTATTSDQHCVVSWVRLAKVEARGCGEQQPHLVINTAMWSWIGLAVVEAGRWGERSRERELKEARERRGGESSRAEPALGRWQRVGDLAKKWDAPRCQTHKRGRPKPWHDLGLDPGSQVGEVHLGPSIHFPKKEMLTSARTFTCPMKTSWVAHGANIRRRQKEQLVVF